MSGFFIYIAIGMLICVLSLGKRGILDNIEDDIDFGPFSPTFVMGMVTIFIVLLWPLFLFRLARRYLKKIKDERSK